MPPKTPELSNAALAVLIVEDVDSMREMLNQLVSELSGYQASGLAANAPEARLELSRRRPDLVLLDEVLPGESGLDLLVELRAQGVPVVLLTGMSDPGHAVPVQALARVSKPSWDTWAADVARFQRHLDDALGRKAH
jgi:DNA-binding NtrC family response regulator